MALGHRKLAAWYLQLSQQLSAGVPLVTALRMRSGAPAADTQTMIQTIERGGTFGQALGETGPWLPAADRIFLSAAADSGRLPVILRRLSDRHTEIAKVSMRVFMACLYPIGVLHFAVMVFALLRMIGGGQGLRFDGASLAQSFSMTLLPLWAFAAVIFVLHKRENPVLAAVLNLMPALRGYRRARALSDFSFALSSLIEAGASIGQAWRAAGQVARSRPLAKASREIDAWIAQGRAPSERLDAFRCFPDEFVAIYRTGEASGQLEHGLLRIAEQQQERANHHLHLATLIYPGALFFLVALGVLYIVVSFYAAYIGQLQEIGGF